MDNNKIHAKILIVEDDKVALLSLKAALEPVFEKVEAAETGQYAKDLSKNESFDILLVADTLTSSFIPIITAFATGKATPNVPNNRYENKMPIGWIGAVSESESSVQATITAYETDINLVDDACYGLLSNQPVKINGASLDLIETVAYYTSLVASTNVGASLTQKRLPNVDGLVTEYTFETGSLGKALVGLGFTVFQTYDRENGEFIVVNSEQHNGYDLYINRVRDYVLREYNFHQYLGNKNNKTTLSEINQECARIKDKCVNTLDFLEDIEYNVVKKNSHCVDVNIVRLVFAGVITEINVYVTIEVE